MAVLGSERLTNFQRFPKPQSPKELEITYYKIKEVAKEIKALSQLDADRQPTLTKSGQDFQHKFQEKDKSLLEKHLSKKLEELPKAPNQPPEEKAIPKNQFVGSHGRLETEPAYIGYYQAVREEIRESATNNYTRHSQEGQIYVSFSLARNGSLASVSIDERRSDANAYLKDVTRRSIKEAVPFPAFPAELSKEEDITFNVIICFSAGSLKLSRQ